MTARNGEQASDFRSDTVTRPSSPMKQAMMDAVLGDDVFGDDPTVQRLQAIAAEMLGFEDALFAPSGTQTNLIALMTHCQRGDEAIVGQDWHTYRWEGGGMAMLGSIQPQPLANHPDGTIPLSDIEDAIKPDDPHFARTRLIALENTTAGRVLPLDYMRSVRALAERHGLNTHLDGARLFNAAVALAQENGADPVKRARDICRSFDSVSVCLSKGLGAPVGSLLLGSKPFITQARRARKALGGGMRQAGILAGAGIYALLHNIQRLADDHENALALSQGLTALVATHPRLKGRVVVRAAQTNTVFTDVATELAAEFLAHLVANDIRVTSSTRRVGERTTERIRWMTHLNISRADVERALQVVAAY